MPILEESDLRHDTNEALPELQKREIHALMSKTNREIELIDPETGDLSHIRDKMVERIAVLKAMVSPVKELPNEILAKIFVQYTQDTDPIYKGAMPAPPWFLGQICSRWRRVALTTSEIWKDFSICVRGFASAERISSSVDETKELFHRAGQSPISLSIDSTSASIAHLVPLFTQNATRLNHLTLGVNGIFQPLVELPGGSLATLRTLVLYLTTNHGAALNKVTLFESSPRLYRVSIYLGSESANRNLDPRSLRLPWSQLTHLHISEFVLLRFHQTCEFLRQCTALISFSLAIPPDDGDIGHVPMLELSNLETLAITNNNIDHHKQFIGHLVVPSLKRFNFLSGIRSSAGLVGLIKRSGCKVEAFKTQYDMPSDILLAILDNMPSLRRLSIHETESFYQIVRRMACENYLPNLQLLECAVENLSSTARKLKVHLGESEFMEPVDDICTMLRLVLVPGHVSDVGYGGIQLMKELERNWLRVGFKNHADENFMEYSSDEEIYRTEWKDDEVSDSGSDEQEYNGGWFNPNNLELTSYPGESDEENNNTRWDSGEINDLGSDESDDEEDMF